MRLRACAAGFAVVLGCQAPHGSDTAVDRRAAAEVRADEPTRERSEGDLLAQARQGLRDGKLDPKLHAAILASPDPAHARARKLLLALEHVDDLIHESSEVAGPELFAPRMEEIADAPQRRLPEAGPTPSTRAPPSAVDRHAAAPTSNATAPAIVTRLQLARAPVGAVLSIVASRRVAVSRVTEADTRSVRLVIQATGALPTALSARPKISGVEVTDVKRGDASVIVTLRLDDGWRMGTTRSVNNGTRVELVGPE